MTIELYTAEKADDWDNFVLGPSVNGNFLQSRRFLSYHPEGRFEDCSLMYFDKKNNLRAVVPAAVRHDGSKKVFVSHPGSTYGGIVLDAKSCTAKKLQCVIDEVDDWCVSQGFSSIDLHVQPDFMWKMEASSLMEYMLGLNGYSERIELTTYIDFSAYKESILSNFAQGKRTNVNNGKKKGLVCRALNGDREIVRFYELLCANLAKHDAKPVHSISELKSLYSRTLAGSTEMLGVFSQEGEMLAAGWIFLFENQGVAHTQYLCADEAYNTLSPMTFLYYSAIEYAKSHGFRYLSWGISTEEHGSVLNWGLTESKEHFGSLHGCHRSYTKSLL